MGEDVRWFRNRRRGEGLDLGMAYGVSGFSMCHMCEGETGDGRHVSIIQCDPLSHACCWVDPEYLLKARKHKVNSYFYDAMMTSGFLIFFSKRE